MHSHCYGHTIHTFRSFDAVDANMDFRATRPVISINTAVGALTCQIDPPSRGTTIPATIAVHNPYWGTSPTAIDKAMESGKATRAKYCDA